MKKLEQQQFIDSFKNEDLGNYSRAELLDYLEEARELEVFGDVYDALQDAFKNARKNEFIYLYKGDNFIQSFDTMNDLLHNLKIDRSNFTRLRDKIEDGFTYKGYKMIKTSSI